MRKFAALLIVMILVISTIGIVTAFAGASISGSSQVVKGRSYKYTGKMSCSGGDLVGKITGLGQTASFNDNASGSGNESLSGSASITVTIPSSAQIGDKFAITLSGQYSTMEDPSNPTGHSFSETKTLTVVAASASTPKPSSKPTAAPSPTATPAPTQWDLAAQSVAGIQAGGALSIDITGDTQIPASLLTALKDKQGTLTINFGSYTCTIDGKALAALPAGTESLNLSMSMQKDSVLSAAVGGEDAYQLHFAGTGQLPGKFTYSFKAESNKPGDTLYLYYFYDQSGVVEGVQSAVVDANGYVTFDIYHCSSYFVSGSIIDKAAGIATGAQLLEAQNKQAAMDSQLKDAQGQAAQLQTQLESAQSQAALAPALPDNVLGIPLGVLIASLAGAAVVGALLAMLVCKAGIFRKKEPNEGKRSKS